MLSSHICPSTIMKIVEEKKLKTRWRRDGKWKVESEI